MIRDSELMFTGVGTSGYAPTAASENVAPFTIDTAPLGLPTGSGGASTPGYNAGSSTNAGRDLGVGGEMWWYVLVTVAVAQAADSATFKLETDGDAAGGSPVVLLSSAAFAAATLIAGYTFKAQLPASLVYERYLVFVVSILTTVWSAGTVESGLITNIQQSDLYLGGFRVS